MKLYNTLSRQIEDFAPRKGKVVELFVCGPTVYDYAHLGHAKNTVQLDILARTLLFLGYDLTYIQNITDIDDKIITRAQERSIDWQKMSRDFEAAYHDDMQVLNNTNVTSYIRATDHIDSIIDQVQRLMDSGNAYRADDGIYFEIATFSDYGKLSGRKEVQEDDSESRIDHSEHKRGWNDFAVWKFAKPGEPSWPAPFGDGRPGWHIEDTAITEKVFGPQYDIHGGGIDLIFPHHEAELTIMETLSGKIPFVKYWVHAGFLTIADTKMSKSIGNSLFIKDVIQQGIDPIALRLFILQSHYRSSVNFTEESLEAAANRLRDYRAMAVLRWQARDVVYDAATFALEDIPSQLSTILSADLATPQALALLSEVSTQLQAVLIEKDMVDHFEIMLEGIDRLLGLDLGTLPDITEDQKQLLHEREAARLDKDWVVADQKRDTLVAAGIGIRDTSQGAIWYYL